MVDIKRILKASIDAGWVVALVFFIGLQTSINITILNKLYPDEQIFKAISLINFTGIGFGILSCFKLLSMADADKKEN